MQDKQINFKLINKMMRLGAGALKGSITLEVTMATKQVLTTQHHHPEGVQWNTYHRVGEKGTETSRSAKRSRQSQDMQSIRPDNHPAHACQPGAQLLTL